jgi:anaerobic nitric oxide reductase flavorubredoxin
MAKLITENLYWVGISNPNSKDFHGINSYRGGSYNSYLLLDEKPTLIDTTNMPFLDEYLKSLSEIINPVEIKYIVINHAEPDHVGALKEILKICKNASVVCTKKCQELLKCELGLYADFIITDNDLELNIGKNSLSFMMTPMCHWPETMMTYIKERRFLFSGDLFGTEISHENLFADEMNDFSDLTLDYFSLVMRPMKFFVIKAIDLTKTLEISYLMPSHGPIYRKNIAEIINRYEELSKNPEKERIAVLYVSIWGSTIKIANQIKKNFEERNYSVSLIDITSTNLIRIMSEVLTSKAVFFGSLTIIGNYHPVYETVFMALKLLNQPNKPTGIFGSHGWAPASVPKLEQKAKDTGFNVISSLDFRFGPKCKQDIDKIDEFALKVFENINRD